MRMTDFGGELQSLACEGWTFSGTSESYASAGSQRQSPTGLGGTYCVVLGAAAYGYGTSPTWDQSLVETLARVALKCSATGDPIINLRNGATTIAYLVRNAFDQIEIYVNAALKDTSTETLSDNTWYTLSIRYRMLSAGGLFEVYLDDDLATPICSFSGDTDPTAATDLDNIQIQSKGDSWDDIAVHGITMLYDGGSGGVPAVGETITGTSSSATAVITAVDGNATSGRLYLRSVSGTFTDNEQVTSSGTFDALVNAPSARTNAPGLEVNSGFPSVWGYIAQCYPTADGAHADCTPYPGTGDNYEEVDDWATGTVNTGTYVESGTDGDQDSYELSNPSASYTGVNSVKVVAWAQRQGVAVNTMELAVRVGGTDYFGDDDAVGTAWESHTHRWDTNPDDSEMWDVADITAMEAGFRLNA